MAQDSEARIAVAAGVLLLLWYWYSQKMALGGAEGSWTPGSSAQNGAGCGCSTATVPYQPANTSGSGVITNPTSSLLMTKVTMLTPPSAPGSNSSASGSGQNWSTSVLASNGFLSGPPAPQSPVSPTSNAIWVANSSVPAVSA